MSYPDEIDLIVKQELKNLIKLYEGKKGPFDNEIVKKYYEKFMLILSNKNTTSKNTSIVIIVSTILIQLEILVIGYIFYRRSKQTELPKLKTYLENPDFVDDDEK